MRFNLLPQVRLLPDTELQLELGWSCKQVMIRWNLSPCFMQNAKRGASARMSPAKMLLHRLNVSLKYTQALSFPLYCRCPWWKGGGEPEKLLLGLRAQKMFT